MATDFTIPHGIAVTIGMDMANFVAYKRGFLSRVDLERMHALLQKNYSTFSKITIPIDALISAILKDKKNVSGLLKLILPVGDFVEMRILEVAPDGLFKSQCNDFLEAMY